MYDAVSVEDRGKPVVALVNYGFANDAESASRGMAMPVVRYVPTKVPCESSVIKDIEEGIDGALEAIITAMTKPLTAEEKSPKPREKENPPRLIFKGRSGGSQPIFLPARLD